MKLVLGAILVYVVFGGPLTAFIFYSIYVKRWSLQRLAPYVVGYFAVIFAVIGWLIDFRGWDLVVSAGIGAVTSWGFLRVYMNLVKSSKTD